MLTTALYVILGTVLFLVTLFVLFTLYVLKYYSGYIDKVFQTMPLLVADKGELIEPSETMSFTSADGRRLEGSYLRSTTGPRRGVVVFLHEFGATRWMAGPYAAYLREEGYDLFTFDFGGCGASEGVPGHEPLQWPTEFELADARGAMAALKKRADGVGPGIALFGISKGGGVGLAIAAEDPDIRTIVTDGAFPVYGMVLHYSMKFIEIFSQSRFIYQLLPHWFYGLIIYFALKRVERERGVRYLDLERAVRSISGKPLLMIRGGRDNYVNETIVGRFFGLAREPKELWVVPKAKHNQCLEREGENYRRRVVEFLARSFPLPPAS